MAGISNGSTQQCDWGEDLSKKIPLLMPAKYGVPEEIRIIPVRGEGLLQLSIGKNVDMRRFRAQPSGTSQPISVQKWNLKPLCPIGMPKDWPEEYPDQAKCKVDPKVKTAKSGI